MGAIDGVAALFLIWLSLGLLWGAGRPVEALHQVDSWSCSTSRKTVNWPHAGRVGEKQPSQLSTETEEKSLTIQEEL